VIFFFQWFDGDADDEGGGIEDEATSNMATKTNGEEWRANMSLRLNNMEAKIRNLSVLLRLVCGLMMMDLGNRFGRLM